MSKITKLIVLNGEFTMSFEVGRSTVDVSDSKVKRIKYNEDTRNYVVFLEDRNEIDIYSRNVITHTKVGMFA